MTPLAEHAAALFNLELSAEHEAAFARYADELLVWNERINLTAITDPDGVMIRHFLDSLTLMKVLELRPGLRVIDVGSGAGFPGLPLQIAYPQFAMTLLEATGKKVSFLQHMIDTLKLPNVQALKGRAEEIGQMQAHRATYDVAVARAVARLPILLEYLMPLVQVGGVCIAMKGKTAHSEVESSRHALTILGGRLDRIEAFQLPGVEETHYLVMVEKTAPTPTQYPRRSGLPSQQPL
ncbi:MAG: 16S rRNA (guanine(527)-N(7))-methyltransferase RsmG [Anaerolineae bacterium]|nr:16S rRNA (guanine(527)-N(7))-methyltransferase RsmG [Anaerolineae bacterium]